MEKYDCDEDYFQVIDSEDKAYWLGFLYADGCINDKNNCYSLDLCLCEKDRDHLEKFRQSLRSDVPIHTKVVRLGDKEYRACRLYISSSKLCCDLIDKKCVPRKTFNILMPSYDIVPKEYMRDFMRGFFDGDGCICVTTTTSGKRKISVSFSGVEAMLNSIVFYLVSERIITINPKMYFSKRSKACSFYLYGDHVKDFLDYIYKNANIYLDRKYEKYVDHYNDYVLNRRGVYWNHWRNTYIVTININGERIRVGQSGDLNTAIQMRKDAEIKKMNCPSDQWNGLNAVRN